MLPIRTRQRSWCVRQENDCCLNGCSRDCKANTSFKDNLKKKSYINRFLTWCILMRRSKLKSTKKCNTVQLKATLFVSFLDFFIYSQYYCVNESFPWPLDKLENMKTRPASFHRFDDRDGWNIISAWLYNGQEESCCCQLVNLTNSIISSSPLVRCFFSFDRSAIWMTLCLIKYEHNEGIRFLQ